MNIAKLATDGTNQIVILRSQFHLSGNEVYMKKMGNGILLTAKDDPWRSQRDPRSGALIDSVDSFSEDFMETREQPNLQIREELF